MFSLLIVDDEEILREGLKDAVPWESWGFQVVALAGSGEEGLECFARLRPDVLMTDIKMYEFSGLDLLKAAKELDADCEVVLLSGYEDFHFAKQGIALGAAAYVLKLNLFDEAEQVFQKLRSRLEAKQELERSRRDTLRQNAAVELGKRLRGEPSAAEELLGDYSVAVLHAPAGSALLGNWRDLDELESGWRIAEFGNNIIVACIPRPAFESEGSPPCPDMRQQLRRLMDARADVIAGIGERVPGSAIEVSFRQAMKMVDYGLLHGAARCYAFEETEALLSDKPVEVPKYDDIQLWIDMNQTDALVQALDRYLLAAIGSKLTIVDVKRVALNVLLE
jgi:DNA-binding NarL/FixJ family response regulator